MEAILSGHKQGFYIFVLFALLLVTLTGCANVERGGEAVTRQAEKNREESKRTEEPATFIASDTPVINEVDYSSYFNGMNGCAVFYTPSSRQYDVYNSTLAAEQHSPCSTFKIISSLLALKEGVIDPQNSVREWSGETFWRSEWNQDIDFPTAFKTSCVWYFRQVVDDLGRQTIQNGLNELEYGNLDISDWSGSLNTNNGNPALTGFWIESSLKISPMRQAEVMARIFEPESQYLQEVLQSLKDVMIENMSVAGHRIYGKTGAGKENGEWVDAWFVGFIEKSGQNTYFAVYLGMSEGAEISSGKAKEIAIQIAGDHYKD